jgi:hypothetical protein
MAVFIAWVRACCCSPIADLLARLAADALDVGLAHDVGVAEDPILQIARALAAVHPVLLVCVDAA